jgi:hypothetical protein
MIRARESMDRWARVAHDVLDQAQRDPRIPGDHINWALAYLGDRTGKTNLPYEIRRCYDLQEPRYA